ncbi:alpha/beta fold hydrolase [Nocardia crassostreae]|uniref:alpha/beta fold hydrolase n=1 Tax=Nocardia crassostreae TaxID=53428 RepID=UPI0008368245|nr:alpha/beta hydrolase [Nocardia crassostreae]
MATFVLIHGGGDVGWYWHLVEAELRARGHESIAPDLPSEDDSATLTDYADAVIEAVGALQDLVVVGQSYGGFTATLAAARLPTALLVLTAAMIPTPGESASDWWTNTDYARAAKDQADQDGGKTGNPDPFISYYNGVPRALAEEALSRERSESSAAYSDPWPLPARPDIPTKFVLFQHDQFFPPAFFRDLVPKRLGITPDELPGCHCAALSHPRELADRLAAYAAEQGLPGGA